MNGTLSGRQAVVLGVIVLLALAVGVFGLFAIGSRQGLWRDDFTLFARFPKINGLDLGTRVRVQGVNAGQVAGIEQPAERGGDVLVRLQLDRKFQTLIGADARAEIVSEGLIGGKSVEIHPGSPEMAAIEPGAVIPGRADQVMDELRRLAGQSDELLDEVHSLAKQTQRTMAEAEGLLHELRQGEGAMGREIAGTLKQVKETSATVEDGFGALKSMPFFGKYVDVPTKLLVRPNAEVHAIVLRESELFEPGKSVLTPSGQQRLGKLAAEELPKYKVAGSEIVIVSYTNGNGDPRASEVLTQQQAEAVMNHLVDEHKAAKLGWIKRRNVIPLGLGTRPPPGGPSSAALPPRRIEIVVFVPPGSVKAE